MTIRAVVFDLDGVVVHPFRFREALERDHRITPAMTESFFRGPFMDCIEGRADVLDVLAGHLGAWGWPGTASDFLECWLKTENAPNAQVLAIVAHLRRAGFPCFVASSQERNRARYLATTMGFERLFDGLVFSCDLGVAKPKPRYYEMAARRLGHEPAELLFFDDTLANVAGHGRRAGAPSTSPRSNASLPTSHVTRVSGSPSTNSAAACATSADRAARTGGVSAPRGAALSPASTCHKLCSTPRPAFVAVLESGGSQEGADERSGRNCRWHRLSPAVRRLFSLTAAAAPVSHAVARRLSTATRHELRPRRCSDA